MNNNHVIRYSSDFLYRLTLESHPQNPLQNKKKNGLYIKVSETWLFVCLSLTSSSTGASTSSGWNMYINTWSKILLLICCMSREHTLNIKTGNNTYFICKEGNFNILTSNFNMSDILDIVTSKLWKQTKVLVTCKGRTYTVYHRNINQ